MCLIIIHWGVWYYDCITNSILSYPKGIRERGKKGREEGWMPNTADVGGNFGFCDRQMDLPPSLILPILVLPSKLRM